MNVIEILALHPPGHGKPKYAHFFLRTDQVTREMKVLFAHLSIMPVNNPCELDCLLVQSIVDREAFIDHDLCSHLREILPRYKNFQHKYDTDLVDFIVTWKNCSPIYPHNSGPVIIDQTYLFYMNKNVC
jgi:hypothetical protein